MPTIRPATKILVDGGDPDETLRISSDLSTDRPRPTAYKELDLSGSWESFDLKHKLTDEGIRRFVDDYKSTLKAAA